MSLLARDEVRENRRELHLRLTAKGRRIYAEIVPLALEREREMMSCLSPIELKRLERLVSKLEQSLGLQQTAAEESIATHVHSTDPVMH
jgi:DNA-binding MarR family transcriptional regulator